MSRRVCYCEDWRENIDKVEGPIVLQAIRMSAKGYEGVQFRFCPWCGKELTPGDVLAERPGKDV